MANYPYDQLGTPLDTVNLDKANGNWAKIAADIASVDSASQQRDTAMTSDYTAKLLAQKNEYTGRLDSQFNDYTARLDTQKAEYTNGFQVQKNRIDNIVSEISGEAFEQVIDESKLNWKPPVADVSALTTTYPNAVEGYTAQTLDDNNIYRYDGSAWVFIQKFGNGPFTAIQKQIDNITRPLSFQDAWVAWENNQKFPVAFFGDSTIDGVGTTGHTNNVIGTDHQPPNAFTTKLQENIRSVTNTVAPRIYNAGFSGRTADWGFQNIEAIFGDEYSDLKMLGIGFGINDRLVANTTLYKEQFKTNIENIILWAFDNDVMPFLLTTQAILQPASSTGTYPLRDSEKINSVANRVKKELAKKYNLELIDINEMTEKLMQNSLSNLTTIINDTLHFGDVGHKFEADLLFTIFCPRVIFAKNGQVLDFSTQKIKSTISELLVKKEANYVSQYHKSFAYHDKTNMTDTLLQEFIVFSLDTDISIYVNRIQTKKAEFTLPATDAQRPYAMINGVKTILPDVLLNSYFTEYGMYLPQKLSKLSFGLNTLQLWSGEFNRVSVAGFILDKELFKPKHEVQFYKNSSAQVIRGALSEYDAMVDTECIYKVELKTNAVAGENILIPLIDRRSHGIGLNITNDVISLLTYYGSLSSGTSPSFSLLGTAYSFGAGSNSKTFLGEFFVKITGGNRIRVCSNLKDTSCWIDVTVPEKFGGFFFANYIYTTSGVANESHAILKATRLV